MTDGDQSNSRLWGRQYPFERNYFQRSMAVLGLASVFSVSLILLVDAEVVAVAGIALVVAGLLVGLSALSRLRYVRESRNGFLILLDRDGRFVLGSAGAFVVAAVLVTLLIID